MAGLTTDGIRQRVLEILQVAGCPLRFREICRQIATESPSTNWNTINTQVAEFPARRPDLLWRPERGLFALKEGIDLDVNPVHRYAEVKQASLPPTEATLLDIGLELVGSWFPDGDGIRYVIRYHEDREQVLYAFAVDGMVVYVGKSTRSLGRRMYGYVKFGSSQRTNMKNNALIREALAASKEVRIYALLDWEPVEHRGLPINVAAGIEDVLIERMRPAWNGRQR